jgi:hypothetical protein
MEVEVDNSRNWGTRHWSSIRASYSRAAFFARYAELLQSVFERRWTRLATLNEVLISSLAGLFGLQAKIIRASELALPEGLSPSGRLAEIVRRADGDTYLSGIGGLEYLDPSAFEGIALRLQDFRHPVYPQLWGPFAENVSALDLLLNVGPSSKSLLQRSGGATAWPEQDRALRHDKAPGLNREVC